MNIVLLDITDNYPVSFSANNSKAEFIARGLLENGCQVHIINNLKGEEDIKEVKSEISQYGIHYITFPHADGFKGWIQNYKMRVEILKKYRINGINGAIIGMKYYHIFLINTLLTKRLGYKSTSLFHEWHISFNHKNLVRKIEAWLKDKTFGYLINGVLPISEFLIEKSKIFKKQILKLPVLADFNNNPGKDRSHPDCFVYCAHADYIRIIEFIIDSYSIAMNKGLENELVLVLHGKESSINKIRTKVEERKLSDKIKVKSKLSNAELSALYKSAIGLLIPLDPESLQDKARFSQKIAEYLTSARPIITSNTGEISYYFRNEKNAVIINFTPEAYANAMVMLANNLELAEKIGRSGWELGSKYFDYKKNADRIAKFIEAL